MYLLHSEFGKKNSYRKYVSSDFLTLAVELHLVRFGFGDSFAFELHCSFYRPRLRCCYYFASHKKICYSASSGLPNSKKLSFTLFLLYPHNSWTATLIRCVLSTTPIYSTAYCTSATSYNYDATITLFLIAQQWRSDAITLNISCSAICTQPRVQPVAILEWKNWGGTAGPRKKAGEPT